MGRGPFGQPNSQGTRRRDTQCRDRQSAPLGLVQPQWRWGHIVGCWGQGQGEIHAQGQTRAQGNLRSDDAVSAIKVFFLGEHVHGPALAITEPPFFAHNLEHHRANFTPFGETVTVSAVGRANPIVVGQFMTYPNTRGFLAQIYMRKSRNVS